jgi:hypothetical protein
MEVVVGLLSVLVVYWLEVTSEDVDVASDVVVVTPESVDGVSEDVGSDIKDDAELLDIEVEKVDGTLEVLGATVSDESPISETVKPPGIMESVGQKASGYVVPSTTVPAAARAPAYSELTLADALKGHAATVVVVAMVVISHPVVVLVDVSQLTELLSSAELRTELQVTYRSYPVVVLVQELVEAVEVTESVGELVGSLVGTVVGSSVG